MLRACLLIRLIEIDLHAPRNRRFRPTNSIAPPIAASASVLGSGTAYRPATASRSCPPLPNVKRIVFIAIPHRGSQWSRHPLGRFGRSFIEFPSELQDRYGGWIEKHNGTLPDAPASVPTSIDLLDPKNPVMLATANVPIASQVKLHSIVGKGHRLPDWSEGDGVVSSQSVHLENTASE